MTMSNSDARKRAVDAAATSSAHAGAEADRAPDEREADGTLCTCPASSMFNGPSASRLVNHAVCECEFGWTCARCKGTGYRSTDKSAADRARAEVQAAVLAVQSPIQSTHSTRRK